MWFVWTQIDRNNVPNVYIIFIQPWWFNLGKSLMWSMYQGIIDNVIQLNTKTRVCVISRELCKLVLLHDPLPIKWLWKVVNTCRKLAKLRPLVSAECHYALLLDRDWQGTKLTWMSWMDMTEQGKFISELTLTTTVSTPSGKTYLKYWEERLRG